MKQGEKSSEKIQNKLKEERNMWRTLIFRLKIVKTNKNRQNLM